MGNVPRLSDPHRLTFAWRYAVAFARWLRDKRNAEFLAAVEEESERLGISARMRAVDDAIRTTAFDDAFHRELDAAVTAGRPPKTESDIRDVAYAALRGMGVDLTDVQFTVFWAGPDGNAEKKLGPNVLRFGGDDERCGRTPEATQRCLDAINARAKLGVAGESGKQSEGMDPGNIGDAQAGGAAGEERDAA